MDCIPADWGDGYDNITIGCTVENQARADERLKIFRDLPIKHKNIIIQPMLEDINISAYLSTDIELVVVGGVKVTATLRPIDYAWVLHVREQCLEPRAYTSSSRQVRHALHQGWQAIYPPRVSADQAGQSGGD